MKELGLEDKVAFLFVAPDELPEVCASSDIAVSLASTDATPASMIESMASGLPLVIGDAITIDEWITQGEGGEVVGCRDEDAITAAMLKLARDPELCRKYVERNLRVVAERFTVPPGEALEQLYYDVLDSHSSSVVVRFRFVTLPAHSARHTCVFPAYAQELTGQSGVPR